LRRLMSANVGVIRDRSGLTRALSDIARIERECRHLPQTRNMAAAALMVTAAALKREESRGGHFRSDFPKTDLPARRTFITLDEARAVAGAVSDIAAPELVPA
jgi:L-aspartate oxidase